MLRWAQTGGMRKSRADLAALICLFLGFALSGAAATFELENGNTFYGEVSKLDEDGLVIRLEEDIGGFSERIELVYLSQETLEQLAENPKYKPFVAPFIEMSEDLEQPPVIVLKPVERLPRASAEASFFSAFASPIGVFFLLAFYLGNLLAAYETAVYRGRSVPLVCGLAVIAPVATPIIFLSLPAAEGSYADPSWEEEVEEAPPPVPREDPRPVGISTNKPSKLGLRQSAAPQSNQAATPSSYTRSNTEFNRHFFETTFSEFFRVVPSPAIKDMVVEFKGTKKELIAKRITRISANEIHLQLLSGKKEAAMRFGEIVQVNLRHKNEK